LSAAEIDSRLNVDAGEDASAPKLVPVAWIVSRFSEGEDGTVTVSTPPNRRSSLRLAG